MGVTNEKAWKTPPVDLTLKDGQLDLWLVQLDRVPEAVGDYLSTEERERAARFVKHEDARAYATARGLLRLLLSRYLCTKPTQITFHYNGQGKPSLGGPHSQSALRFNLSHSHGMALLGFVLGREIGVDIEKVRKEAAGEEIANHFFSASEKELLRSLPAGQRTKGFFQCWTRKEAYIKASGDGLSRPLDSFAVQFGPDAPPMLLSASDPQELTRWTWLDVPIKEDFCGAAVIQGGGLVVNHWRFTV